MNEQLQYHIYKKFDIIQKLGNGTYGVVYKVIDKKTKNICALKKIIDAFQNKTDTQRTYRQILYLSQIKHNNIVQLLDVIQSKNNKDIYIVFEFIQFDISKILKSCQLQPIQRKHIIYQLINAVAYLHSIDILHRDIKPSNILIDRQCNIKLCDFGLSRNINSFKQKQTDKVMTQYVAARWYRPPEIILGIEKYSYGVDIWGIGCVMAELLLKRPLFLGHNTLDQLQKILSIIGMPKKSEIEKIESHEARNILNTFSQFKKTSLSDILCEASDEQLDLLMNLLEFNPSQRISAKDALNHSYFSELQQIKRKLPKKIKIKQEFGCQMQEYISLIKNIGFKYKQFDKTSNYTTTNDEIVKRKIQNSNFIKSTQSIFPPKKKSLKSKSRLSYKDKTESKSKLENRRPSKTKYENTSQLKMNKFKNQSILKLNKTKASSTKINMNQVNNKKQKGISTVSQKIFRPNILQYLHNVIQK